MPATLKDVSIDKCVVDPNFNTRRNGVGDITDLVASIRSEGILQPLLGKDRGNTKKEIEIFAGFRRLAAAQEAELKKIPVMVSPRRAISKQQMLSFNVIENIQRETLNSVDEALAFQRLQTDHSLSVDEICATIGVKKNRVQQRFRLLKLEEVVREAVHAERISIAAAFEIDRLPKHKQAKFVDIAEDLSGQKLTSLINKEIEKIQKQVEGTEPTVKDPGAGPDPDDVRQAEVTEHVRLIKKASSIICAGLGYDKEKSSSVRKIDFRSLEVDDLKVVAKLFDDCADQVEDDIDVNEKASEEIVSHVEGAKEGLILDEEAPVVRQALIRIIFARAKEIAVEKADGRRAKVTYAIAKEALDEFYSEYETEVE